MTLPEIKNLFHEKLDSLYPETEIDSFFYLLLEQYSGTKKLDLALNPELRKKEWPQEKFLEALNQLLEERPIQYILGRTEFAGHSFLVNENVLIPRPETEELIEWVLQSTDSNQSIKILDIGTGSGCIPICLAMKMPKAEIHALDISAKALELAEENARNLKANVRFFEQDILETHKLDTYDVIISNPPYVRISEKKQMRGNVLKHEPDLALYVQDEDPLLFYRKIAALGQESLSDKGMLFFEINENLARPTSEILSENDYQNIEIKKDIYGKNRMIRAFKK